MLGKDEFDRAERSIAIRVGNAHAAFGSGKDPEAMAMVCATVGVDWDALRHLVDYLLTVDTLQGEPRAQISVGVLTALEAARVERAEARAEVKGAEDPIGFAELDATDVALEEMRVSLTEAARVAGVDGEQLLRWSAHVAGREGKAMVDAAQASEPVDVVAPALALGVVIGARAVRVQEARKGEHR